MLRTAGVAAVRGFALNATHYDGTSREIAFGARIVSGLRAAGIRGAISSSTRLSNGRPVHLPQYHGPDFDNAAVCRSRQLVPLRHPGHPADVEVTDPRWHLSPGAVPGRGRPRSMDTCGTAGRGW